MAADTALLFDPEGYKGTLHLPYKTIGVAAGFYYRSLAADKQLQYFLSHSRTLDRLIEKYGFNVVFLPHDVKGFEHDDFTVCDTIRKYMRRKDRVKIIRAKTVEEYICLLKQINLLLTSKMHPAVLASKNYIPMVTVSYDHKQVGFFKQIGLEKYLIDITRVSSKELLSLIELAWSEREKIQKRLQRKIPEMQEMVRTTIRKSLSINVPAHLSQQRGDS
jgi:polysaccharide pyruvyl transferase WcaK-like protein